MGTSCSTASRSCGTPSGPRSSPASRSPAPSGGGHPSAAAARPARRPAPPPRLFARARRARAPPDAATAPTPDWRCRNVRRRCPAPPAPPRAGPARAAAGRSRAAAAALPRRSAAANGRPITVRSAASTSPRSSWMPAVNAAANGSPIFGPPHTRSCSVASPTDCSASSSRPSPPLREALPQVDRERGEEAAGGVRASPGSAPEVAAARLRRRAARQRRRSTAACRRSPAAGRRPTRNAPAPPRRLGPRRRASARTPASRPACERRHRSPATCGSDRSGRPREAARACSRRAAPAPAVPAWRLRGRPGARRPLPGRTAVAAPGREANVRVRVITSARSARAAAAAGSVVVREGGVRRGQVRDRRVAVDQRLEPAEVDQHPDAVRRRRPRRRPAVRRAHAAGR